MRMGKRISLLLAAFVALMCVWIPAVAGAEPAEGDGAIEGAFTDAVFLEEVRKIIGKIDGEHIYGADVESITELIVNRYNKKPAIKSLDGIEYFTGLEKLDCGGNELHTLDLSHNPNLKEVECYANDLVTLDLSHDPKLEVLDCSFNFLESLDISNCPELKWLDTNDNELQELDVSQNAKLTTLICYETELRTLDISNNVWLEKLDAWGGHLVNLDVSNNTRLKYLECRYNDMCAVDSIRGLESCAELKADAFFFEPQNGPTGQHTPGTDWEMDGISHWHTCTVCGVKQDKAGHVYDDDQDALCNTCGYQRTVTPPDPPAPPASHSSSHIYCTITAIAGEGGRIDPSGRVSVREGRDKAFTITPSEGYEIADVLVDGKSVGAVAEYGFEKVSKAHTIEAAFWEAAPGRAPCPKDESCPIWLYTDADTGEWYHDGVHYCIEEGLMSGYGCGRFCPNDALTRGMLVQILYNEAGRPAASGDSLFDDVASGTWYADAVDWAAEKNIVEGHGNGKFCPDEPVTREQLAAMLYRHAGKPGHLNGPLPFDDMETVSSYALDALSWTVEKGIMNGKESRLLAPKGKATRAEVAAMLQRYLAL